MRFRSMFLVKENIKQWLISKESSTKIIQLRVSKRDDDFSGFWVCIDPGKIPSEGAAASKFD